MKKYFIISIAITLILFYSCESNESYFPDDLSSNIAQDIKAEAYGNSNDYNEEVELEEELADQKTIHIPYKALKNVERKLIKEGIISFETEDAKKTKTLINRVANGLNGYLAKDNEYTSDFRIEHSITIRVPSDNFDKLLMRISNSVDEIDDQNITVRDVTEEYVDVQARLKAKKTVEMRYLQLLNKAHSVGDILTVEHELSRIREQIEASEGRIRYLKDQVSLSTLNISFYQNLDVPEADESNFKFFEKVEDAFKNGFTGLLWIIIGLINVWPLLLFIGLLIWIVKRLIKKVTKKNYKLK